MPLAAIGLTVGATAAGVAAVITGNPLLLLALPFATIGAAVCARFPAGTAISVFALTGFQNTFVAYLGLPPAGTADLLLAGLWLGVVWSYARGGSERPLWLWPGLLAPGLYLLLTAVSILTGDSVSVAFDSFRIAGWHMAALFMIALAPWHSETVRKIVRGLVLLALAVGTYAIMRKIAGQSGAETAIGRGSRPGTLATEQPFFGSFFTPQDLAGWCGMLVPFCFSLALGWRNRWGLISALAATSCLGALLVADRRSAFVGAAIGLVLVTVLHLAARRPFGGRRLGMVFIAVAGALAIGAGAFALTVGQSQRTTERFQSLLNDRDNDYTYQLRLSRWEAAADKAAERPLGHGLGTVGEVGEFRADEFPIAPFLDSSYLKIALEQGYPVLILFIGALLWLGAGLAWRGINSSSPERAAIALGACGTLACMMTLFYSSFFIERLTVLSGWLILGLAAAQFTAPRANPNLPAP